MVARAGGYYGAPFKGFLRVIQGNPISPTIFNVVLDAFLQHWVTVVAKMKQVVDPAAAGTDYFGRDVQRLAAYSHADDGLIASTQATRLQRYFDILM